MIPFTVKQLLILAKLGSRHMSIKVAIDKDYNGVIPGAESETFDEIEAALVEKFPNGIIVDDIS